MIVLQMPGEIGMFVANGTIQAMQAVYASQRGAAYVTANPLGNEPFVGIAMGNAEQYQTVSVQFQTNAKAIERCMKVGGAYIGGMKRMVCDLPEGHAGNHKHGDFAWTDADQEARDKQIAAEAEATLDRELGALDAILADVETPTIAKIYIDGEEVGEITDMQVDLPAMDDAYQQVIDDADEQISKLILGKDTLKSKP